MKTLEEINEQIDLAIDKIDSGETFFGMTYEEGVKAALEWVTEQIDDAPMDD